MNATTRFFGPEMGHIGRLDLLWIMEPAICLTIRPHPHAVVDIVRHMSATVILYRCSVSLHLSRQAIEITILRLVNWHMAGGR